MPKVHIEPLAFCIAWAAVAIGAGIAIGIWTGILFSVGLAFILMPLSATIVSKTENFALERRVRWGLLAIAAATLAIWAQLQSSSSS